MSKPKKAGGNANGKRSAGAGANRYPQGWDDKKVKRVLRHYERQTPEQAAAEDEAPYRSRKHTIVAVPVALLPAVRKLIAGTAG
jgi:hypothetical protein